MSKSVDGGEVCKECQGKCCHSCWNSGGFFCNRISEFDRKRFTNDEWALILRIQSLPGYGEQERDLARQLGKLVGATFDDKDKKGFQSSNGCTLPREKRSGTCLRFRCLKLAKALNITDDWSLEKGDKWIEKPNGSR